MRARTSLCLLLILSVAATVLPALPVTAAGHAPAVMEEEEWARPVRTTTLAPEELKAGDRGAWVRLLQLRLADAGFRPGRVDGEYGPALAGTVVAFQKLYELPRDGVFRRDYWPLLNAGLPRLEPLGEADHVEIDLGRQILILVRDGEVRKVLPVSSGNGALYANASGRLVRANTPEGRFTFRRRVNGWRISYLGGLYRPFYFRGGYAVHGSSRVPAYPASHGCVRVPIRDMDYLANQLWLGMPVYVYGKRLDRADLIAPVAAKAQPPPLRVLPFKAQPA